MDLIMTGGIVLVINILISEIYKLFLDNAIEDYLFLIRFIKFKRNIFFNFLWETDFSETTKNTGLH